MRITSISMNGFLSYATDTRLELEDISLCSVTGLNGSGKSSLFQVIPWVLFGSVRINKDKDTVVNDNSEEAIGIVELFGNDGVQWKFTRTRVRAGGSSLKAEWYDFDDNIWVQHSDHRIDSAQQIIYEAIGISELAFNSLSYVKNSAGTAFITADSSVRRNILMSLIPSLGIWQKLQAEFGYRLTESRREMNSKETLFEHLEDEQTTLASDVAEAEKAIHELSSKVTITKSITETETRIEGLRSTISSSQDGRSDVEAQLRALEAERRAHNAAVNSKISGFKSQLRERSTTDRLIERESSKLEALSDRLHDSKIELKDLGDFDDEEIENEIAGDETSLAEFREILKSSGEELSVKTSKLEEIDERLGVMDTQHSHGSAKCLVCDSDLTDEKLKSLMKDLEKQEKSLKKDVTTIEDRIESGKTRISRTETRIKKSRKEIAERVSERSELEKTITRLSEDIEELDGTIKGLTETLSEIPSKEKLDSDIIQVESTLTEESEQEDELRSKLDKLDEDHPLTPELNRALAELTGHRAELTKLERIQSQLVLRKENLKKNIERLKTTKEEVLEGRAKIENLEWLNSACNPKGIPSILITDILNDLQRRQNEMLARLYGANAMEVEYRQIRNNKSNDGTQDVLDIIVHLPGGRERPVESCSSGELIRVTLTNLLSMIQVFNERNSTPLIENLFLDEALGVLDPEVIPVILDILRDALAQDIVESVIIIAHDENVIQAMPQNIRVTKDTSTDLTSMVEVTL